MKQHAEIPYLLYFVTQIRGYSALSKNAWEHKTKKTTFLCSEQIVVADGWKSTEG